ncbi:MAG: SDR family oxidoreductase [Rhodospirillum sp.]|nr:SDR family oxidoreductase [Rhodospirillum sp.]MCF8490581.1 SDR family oxidoreductase [Rhodospirillum sp.]MCF8502719.1 SDR family oxidoreductase [Rhodospirillum sp.]
MDMLDLTGRVALVTGGARGLGAGIAETLARHGARVVAGDVLLAEGEAAAGALRAEGLAVEFAPLDVTDAQAWADRIADIEDRHGRLDILVSNAGINMRHTIDRTDWEEWDHTLRVNLGGAFLGIKAAVPLMRTGGGGSIIVISSTSGLVGHPDAAYSASKWALRGLTKTAALEYADDGIRVNSVHPGSTPTPLHGNAPPGHAEVWNTLIPMARQGKVPEVASTVLFLASDASSYITGTEVAVDGGLSQCGLLTGRKRLLERM